MGYH